MVGRIDAHHHAKFSRNCSIQSRHIAIFQICKTPPHAAILDFWNCKIILATRVESVETHQHAKFCQNWSVGWEDIYIFRFFKTRLLPSWIVKFAKFYWLTVSGGHRRITVANFVKIGHSIAEILQFFKFSKWPPPPSWIFEIVKLLAIWVEKVETHQNAKFRQNRSIGCEILRFFVFQDGGRHHVGLSNSRNFNGWRCPEVQTHHSTKFC